MPGAGLHESGAKPLPPPPQDASDAAISPARKIREVRAIRDAQPPWCFRNEHAEGIISRDPSRVIHSVRRACVRSPFPHVLRRRYAISITRCITLRFDGFRPAIPCLIGILCVHVMHLMRAIKPAPLRSTRSCSSAGRLRQRFQPEARQIDHLHRARRRARRPDARGARCVRPWMGKGSGMFMGTSPMKRAPVPAMFYVCYRRFVPQLDH